jgi:hypothetical protein
LLEPDQYPIPNLISTATGSPELGVFLCPADRRADPRRAVGAKSTRLEANIDGKLFVLFTLGEIVRLRHVWTPLEYAPGGDFLVAPVQTPSSRMLSSCNADFSFLGSFTSKDR